MKRFLYTFEKIINRNLFIISLIFILLLLLLFKKGILEINLFLPTIGGIIAFYYGYKRYERDKELELIREYSIDKTLGITTIDYGKWLVLYNLEKKLYLSKDLFDIVDNYNVYLFLKEINKIQDVDIFNDLLKTLIKIKFVNCNFFNKIHNVIYNYYKDKDKDFLFNQSNEYGIELLEIKEDEEKFLEKLKIFLDIIEKI